MDFEPSKHEPEEYDPETEFRDPNSDSITIPEVSVPSVSANKDAVPTGIQTTFWALVFVIKAAMITTSLGVLFLVFGTDQTLGVTFLGGGLVLFAFALRRYRTVDLSGLPSNDERQDDTNQGESPTDTAETNNSTAADEETDTDT